MVLVNFLFLRKKTPAEIAKKRLQKIISERRIIKEDFKPYYLPQLKKDMLQAMRKHIHDPHILSIQLEKNQEHNQSILKCKIIFFNKKI